ncbi:MAG: Rab family GTPase [Candidatus Thorarchaeota archaeon]
MPVIKAIVLGDSEVGKTSFTTRWTQGTFPDPSKLKTTIGASFDTKRVTLNTGNEVVLSLWDFGGQRRFIETLKSMVKGSKVGLFFFDVSHLQSLDSLWNYWIPLAEDNGDFDFSKGDGKNFLLVGNKIDLIKGSFEKVESEMDRFCKRFGMDSALLSAKTGVGIEMLDFKFKELLQDAL